MNFVIKCSYDCRSETVLAFIEFTITFSFTYRCVKRIRAVNFVIAGKQGKMSLSSKEAINRQLIDPHVLPARTRMDTKKQICQDITSSAYFDMMGEDPIEPDEVYRGLHCAEYKYAEIVNHFFEDGFEKENIEKRKCSSENINILKRPKLNESDPSLSQLIVEKKRKLKFPETIHTRLPDLNMDASLEMDISSEEDGENEYQLLIDVHKAYKELESQYPPNMRFTFEENLTHIATNQHVVYRNPTTLINIRLGSKIVSEYAFSCLTRDRKKRRIRQYYVSDNYLMEKAADKLDDKIKMTGHFIFQLVYNTYVLRGIAEESAKVVADDQFSVEKLYLRMRRYYHPAERNYEDPICDLTKSEKIRICTSVLSSSRFKNRIKYFPNSDLFEDDCEKFEITIRAFEKNFKPDEQYKEWMLYCSAEPDEENARTEYFISRSYNSHLVFVYVRDYSTRKLYLENLSKYVGLVMDKCSEPHCLNF